MIEINSVWTPDFQQQCYRVLLDAMARPGQIQAMDSDPRESGTLAILATLLDASVSLADPHQILQLRDWRLLQATKMPPEEADFIVCRGEKAPSFEPQLGTLPSPERSATIVIRVSSVSAGNMHLLCSGPGVQAPVRVAVSGLHSDWLRYRRRWIADFPLGVDLLLVDATAVLALPRTTTVEVV